MANERVLYVPWQQSEAGSLARTAQQFLENAPKAPTSANKDWQLLYYAPERDYLSRLQMSDQIYVLGHCSPGSTSISTGGSGSKVAGFQVVCDRLEENGLRREFAGKIKFYNCSGALEKCGKIAGPESFAGRAAKLLRDREFRQCSIFSYSAPVQNPDEMGKKAYGINMTQDIRRLGRVVGKETWISWMEGEGARKKQVQFGPNAEVIIPVDLRPKVPSPPIEEKNEEWSADWND